MHTEFATTDIVLAAFIKLSGHELVKITKKGLLGTFIFKDVPANTIEHFHLGSGLVEPITFNNAIKSLTTAVRRLPT